MRTLGMVCCLLALAACSHQSPGAPSPVERRVVLAPGQSVFVGDARVTILFDGVTGDSRCPADVVCVWAGDATVRLHVTSPAVGTRACDLHTADRHPVTHDGVTIALVELAPYPFSAHPIPREEYRATLQVTR